MKCSKIRDKLMDYIAEELPMKEAREVSDHLVYCESCRAFLALAQRASRALNYLREEEPAPQVLSAVRQRIDGEKVARRPIPAIRFAVTLSIIFIGGLVIAGWFLRSPLVHNGSKVVKHNEYLESPLPKADLREQGVPSSTPDLAIMSDRSVQQVKQSPVEPKISRVKTMPVSERRRALPASKKVILARKSVKKASAKVELKPNNEEPVMVFVLAPREPEVYTIQVSADAESGEAETPATELNVVREFDVGGRVTSVTIAETVASANIY